MMKSALVIHVYYIEVLSDILSKYELSCFHKVYITTIKEHEEMCYKLASNLTIPVSIRCFDNVGYDIIPFLRVLPECVDDKIDLVCKIHTKKGSANLDLYYPNIGSIWGDILAKEMLTNVDHILESFKKDDEISCLFSSTFYKSSKFLGYGNEHIVTELLSKINYNGDPAKEVGFVAGTMFWSRIEMLMPLLELNLDEILRKEKNNISQSGQYSSYWHAIERLFGYLPHMLGGKVGLSFSADIERSNIYLISIDTEEVNNYINRSGVGIGLVSELFIKNNYTFLRENIDEMEIKFSRTNCLGIDPILYYLRYGVFLGEELIPWFNSYSYWHDYPESINKRYNPLVHYILTGKSNTILPATENINAAVELVKDSNLFDASFYLRENTDVANSGMSPILHFCSVGWKEGRDPSAKFELIKYYQDVLLLKQLNINPLIHHLIWKNNINFRTWLKRKLPNKIKIAILKLFSK